MFKEVGGTVFYVRDLGGPGSGNFGHAGRPGMRGGSGGGGESKSPKPSSGRVIHQDLSKGGLDLDLKESDITSRGYTSDEAKLLIDYKESGYLDINSGAIDGNSGSVISNKISMMDKIISDSALPENTVLYHGMGETEGSLFQDASEGTEFSNKAFYSTSLSEKTAKDFSKYSSDGAKRILVINMPKGSKGFFYGDTKGESEVVLPRNQKFVVNKVNDTGKDIYYHVSPVAS